MCRTALPRVWLDKRGDAKTHVGPRFQHAKKCVQDMFSAWHLAWGCARRRTHILDIMEHGGWWQWAHCQLKNNLHKTPLQSIYVITNFLIWLLMTPAHLSAWCVRGASQSSVSKQFFCNNFNIICYMQRIKYQKSQSSLEGAQSSNVGALKGEKMLRSVQSATSK